MIKVIIIAVIAYLVWHFWLSKVFDETWSLGRPKTELSEDKYFDYKPDPNKLEKLRKQFKDE